LDEQLTALAASAATAMVGACATDAWERVRAGIVHLWTRHRTAASADQLGAELDRARAELLAEAGPAEPDPALVALWEERFRLLLEADPAAARALRALVAECADADGDAPEADGDEDGEGSADRSGGPEVPTHVEMRGEARDHGQVFQSAGNMNVRQR
jgi:hypothetical protein